MVILTELNGVIILNKPTGFTSHDCIMKVRKMVRMKRVGHTGTLDPDVTGVLPICIGRSTKVAEYITDAGKEYVGEVTLGFSTTTEDRSGDIVQMKKVNRAIDRSEILLVLSKLTGTITQTPPMFSAVKVNGKRLYDYALKGIEVDRPSREVQVYDIELLDEREAFTGEEIKFSFRVSCGKGTYVRTLAVTMGEMLGFPAHMSKLERTRVANFAISDAVSFEQLGTLIENGNMAEILKPIEAGVSNLPQVIVEAEIAKRVKNGAVFVSPAEIEPMNTPTAIFSQTGELLAIYQDHPSKPNKVKPVKII